MSKIQIHQGDVLLLLSRKDRRSVQQIADEMGIGRTYLSRLFNLTTLPNQIISAACDTFNVTPDVFDVGRLISKVDEALTTSETMQTELNLQKQLYALKEQACNAQIKEAHARITALDEKVNRLESENKILRHSRN